MRTKNKVNELALILVTFILFTIIAIPSQAAPIVLKMGTVEPPMNAISLAGERLTKLVDEKSNGRLNVQLFPASQLGNFTTQIEAVMMGGQEMFFGSSRKLGSVRNGLQYSLHGVCIQGSKTSSSILQKPLKCRDKRKTPKEPWNPQHRGKLGSIP